LAAGSAPSGEGAIWVASPAPFSGRPAGTVPPGPTGGTGTLPFVAGSPSTASASPIEGPAPAACVAGGAGISASRRGGAIAPPVAAGADGGRRATVAVACATTRCSSSRARSGARPAHSRRRFSSRACEK
jgi:hypothetical protein